MTIHSVWLFVNVTTNCSKGISWCSYAFNAIARTCFNKSIKLISFFKSLRKASVLTKILSILQALDKTDLLSVSHHYRFLLCIANNKIFNADSNIINKLALCWFAIAFKDSVVSVRALYRYALSMISLNSSAAVYLWAYLTHLEYQPTASPIA